MDCNPLLNHISKVLSNFHGLKNGILIRLMFKQGFSLTFFELIATIVPNLKLKKGFPLFLSKKDSKFWFSNLVLNSRSNEERPHHSIIMIRGVKAIILLVNLTLMTRYQQTLYKVPTQVFEDLTHDCKVNSKHLSNSNTTLIKLIKLH